MAAPDRRVAAWVGAVAASGVGWLSLIGCGVGMLVVPAAYVACVRLGVRRREGHAPATALGSAYVMSLAAGFALAGAGVAGAATASRLVTASGAVFSDTWGGALGFASGVALFGAVTAPLLRLPQYYAAPGRDGRFGAALRACLAHASLRPLRELGLAVLVAVLFVGPGLLAIGLHQYAAVLLGALTTPLCAELVSRSAAPPPLLEEEPLAAPAGLRFAVLSAAAAAVMAVAAFAELVLVPLDAAEVSEPGFVQDLREGAWLRPLPYRLPGTEITLREAPTGVRVEAADGGGAGPVRVWGGSRVVKAGLPPSQADGLGRGEPVRVALLTAGDRAATLCLDRRGVRCDDDYAARLSARWSGFLWAPLWVVLLLGLHLGWRTLPELHRWRTLRELERDGVARGRRAVTGRIRWLEEPGALRRSRLGRCWLEGRFLVEGRDGVVRGPDGAVRVLAPGDPESGGSRCPRGAELGEGDEVTLAGDYASLSTGGYRQGPLPPPRRPLLFVGSLAAARSLAAAAAARRATGSLLVIALAEVVFAVMVTLY